MNTVLGTPEAEFRKIWISKLWQAMMATGRGFRRRATANHTGKDGDRRKDKIGTTKLQRRLGLLR